MDEKAPYLQGGGETAIGKSRSKLTEISCQVLAFKVLNTFSHSMRQSLLSG